MEKESSSFLAQAKNFLLPSKDSKEVRVRLKNLELIIYTGSILDCKVDAIVNSLDSSLEFKSKVCFIPKGNPIRKRFFLFELFYQVISGLKHN